MTESSQSLISATVTGRGKYPGIECSTQTVKGDVCESQTVPSVQSTVRPKLAAIPSGESGSTGTATTHAGRVHRTRRYSKIFIFNPLRRRCEH